MQESRYVHISVALLWNRPSALVGIYKEASDKDLRTQ